MRRISLVFAFLAGGLLLIPATASAKRFKLKNNPRVNQKKARAKADDARFKIDSFRITRLRGHRFELSVGAYHRTARKRSDVVIYYVDGAQKHRVWSDKLTFAKRRGGFSNNMTVNLAGRQGMHRAHLEVVAKACRDLPQCHKRINLNGGDLHIEGRPEFRRVGSSSRLTLKVKNEGPGRAPQCTAELKVDGRTLASKRVSRLRAGRETSVSFDYPRNKRNKTARVELKCRDLERSNNARELRLR